jgi:hypothetical protein
MDAFTPCDEGVPFCWGDRCSILSGYSYYSGILAGCPLSQLDRARLLRVRRSLSHTRAILWRERHRDLDLVGF